MEEEKTTAQNLAGGAKDLKDHVSDFLGTYIELTGVRLAEKVIALASALINFAAIALLSFLFLFMLTFGLAWWIGDLINSHAGGFFIVAGFYLLCVILLISVGKKTFIPFLRNLVTRLIYD